MSDLSTGTTAAPAAAPATPPASPLDVPSGARVAAEANLAEIGRFSDQRPAPPAAQQQSTGQQQPDAQPAKIEKTTAPDGKERVRINDLELSEGDLRTLMQYKAESDLRAASVPAAPEEYQAALPENFVAPEGVMIEFDEHDPAMAAARHYAHRHGLNQADFSEMLAIYAGVEAAKAAQYNHAYRHQVSLLGASGPARVDTILMWMKGMVGAEADALANALRIAPVASTITAFETMMKKFTSQGAGTFQQNGRVSAESDRIAGYESMTFEQRRAAQDARQR